jgi:hypothetical protein
MWVFVYNTDKTGSFAVACQLTHCAASARASLGVGRWISCEAAGRGGGRGTGAGAPRSAPLPLVFLFEVGRGANGRASLELEHPPSPSPALALDLGLFGLAPVPSDAPVHVQWALCAHRSTVHTAAKRPAGPSANAVVKKNPADEAV